jgi:hypothetical protein
LPADVQRFKNTYVHERRFLERFRWGSSVLPYHPASSLDGKSRFDTPEEKDGENQWKAVYKKLVKAQEFNPTHFVRILFKVLRGSSLAVPTLIQLASPGVLELVTAHQKELKFTLMEEFVAESQRARSSVTISQKGVGHPVFIGILRDRRQQVGTLTVVQVLLGNYDQPTTTADWRSGFTLRKTGSIGEAV